MDPLNVQGKRTECVAMRSNNWASRLKIV